MIFCSEDLNVLKFLAGTKIEAVFSTGDDFLPKFSSGRGSQWVCEKGVYNSTLITPSCLEPLNFQSWFMISMYDEGLFILRGKLCFFFERTIVPMSAFPL